MSTNKKLQNEILNFKQKIKKTQYIKTKPIKNKNIVFIYGIFADILAGVITAFILNNIYKHFFKKNTIIFALLLIFCIAGSFYGTMKMLLKQNSSVDNNKEDRR